MTQQHGRLGPPLSLSIVGLAVAGMKIAKYPVALLGPQLSPNSSIVITRQRTLLCLRQTLGWKIPVSQNKGPESRICSSLGPLKGSAWYTLLASGDRPEDDRSLAGSVARSLSFGFLCG